MVKFDLFYGLDFKFYNELILMTYYNCLHSYQLYSRYEKLTINGWVPSFSTS